MADDEVNATPRRPRADARRNRARLLEAAREAFAAGENVTLEQIAREAGVGIGTFYRHFPNREALVEALYRDELAHLCDSAPELLAQRRPDRALRAWMDRFADYAEAKREMADALRALIDAGVVTAAQSRARLAEALTAILEAGAADGTLRPGLRAEDLVTAIVGVVGATAVAGGREQLERLFDLLMDGARGPAAEPACTGSAPASSARASSDSASSVPQAQAPAPAGRTASAAARSGVVRRPGPAPSSPGGVIS